MKLYRVLPNIFFTRERLEETNAIGVESVYYTMGYTAFSDKGIYHTANNYYKSLNEPGKYMFLFFEDAIKYGTGLLNVLHGLNIQSYTVVEYNIPVEIVLKNIGVGDYTRSIIQEFAVETYINKSDITGERFTAADISTEQKISKLIDYFYETLSNLKIFNEYDLYDYPNDVYYDDIGDLLNSKKRLKETVISSNLLQSFLTSKRELIASPFITGNIFHVNPLYYFNQLSAYDKPEIIQEYFEKKGIRCDFSTEQTDFKNDVLYYTGANRLQKKDPEKIKQLLKERNYIK